MKNSSQKSNLKRILYSRIVLFLLGVLLLFFAWGVFGFMNKMKTTTENKKILLGKIMDLQNKKEKLTTDIEKLKTEEGIEENIRTKFGLAKEGEEMTVVVDSQEKSKEIDPENEGFWSKFNFWKN
jgi:cell division protein FtsB